jgi:hypothetical protein
VLPSALTPSNHPTYESPGTTEQRRYRLYSVIMLTIGVREGADKSGKGSVWINMVKIISSNYEKTMYIIRKAKKSHTSIVLQNLHGHENSLCLVIKFETSDIIVASVHYATNLQSAVIYHVVYLSLRTE